MVGLQAEITVPGIFHHSGMSHLFKRCVRWCFLITENSHNSGISMTDHSKVAWIPYTKLKTVRVRSGLRTRSSSLQASENRQNQWGPNSGDERGGRVSCTFISAFSLRVLPNRWARRQSRKRRSGVRRGSLCWGDIRWSWGPKNRTWEEKHNPREVSEGLHGVTAMASTPSWTQWLAGSHAHTPSNRLWFEIQRIEHIFCSLSVPGEMTQDCRD